VHSLVKRILILVIVVCNYANAPKKCYFISQKHTIWPKLLDLQGQNCAVLTCPVQRRGTSTKFREVWIFTVDETGVQLLRTPNKALTKGGIKSVGRLTYAARVKMQRPGSECECGLTFSN
jgi:hypothetical protein